MRRSGSSSLNPVRCVMASMSIGISWSPPALFPPGRADPDSIRRFAAQASNPGDCIQDGFVSHDWKRHDPSPKPTPCACMMRGLAVKREDIHIPGPGRTVEDGLQSSLRLFNRRHAHNSDPAVHCRDSLCHRAHETLPGNLLLAGGLADLHQDFGSFRIPRMCSSTALRFVFRFSRDRH